VNRTIIYDIAEQMSDPADALAHYSTEIDHSWLKCEFPANVHKGLLVSADRDIRSEDIPTLISKFDARAADWESGAIAWVARQNGTRCLILRGVSDLVGEQGGEAYANIEVFRENTRLIMENLLRILDDVILPQSG
jgi:adenosylhomocysteine nucleosidase